ncbi:HAD family hydrolase [Paeniglutamicibacter antarcticus]|uniref:HAD family hydrolase n=1 Tax=Arthrobacter terrae TaxID=2935737 RepID=A0A931CV09_9MICC|nr:HAD family hydrolase [Arthrobacter terrae]MBG0741459.1 HAD family hydrolase [Arthrobacter terrae]
MTEISSLERAAASELPLLLLDFDGTVCLGDGPVVAYAEAAAERMPAAARGGLIDGLERFLANHPGSPAHKDGYAAVATLTADYLDTEELNSAYTQSRERIAAGGIEISAAPGLHDFLAGLAGRAFRVLLTNAPRTGISESLAELGLTDVLDGIIAQAAKPAGFHRLLPQLLKNRAAEEVLSVGDVWVNDIDLPGRFGCATAFIDRFNHRTGPANLHAASFDQLYPGIGEWAQNPRTFQQNHPATPVTATMNVEATL